MAAAASLLVFREIHIITFVFGTTLIGTCVDYSVHFFVHWKGNTSLKNGLSIRSHIIKNITMSFISTQICFIVFFLAPFPILKQFAVFSMTGIISSYLTFFCIYPRFKVPCEEKRKKLRFFPANQHEPIRTDNPWLKKARVFLLPVFIITILTVLVFNYSSVKIENNLSSLYTMSNTLLESEIRTAQILDYGSPGWYFIVSGSTQQETLENEERLTARLQEEIERGNLGAFLATSTFVPSISTQKKTYQAMQALIPLAAAQFEYLGFPQQYAQDFEKEFLESVIFCLPEDAPSQSGVSNLWIGKQGENYYSCVMPLKPTDETAFRAIAEEFGSVHFVNKAKDIGHDMDTLTRTMLILFLAAYIIVCVIIRFVFPWRDSLKICSVPLLLVLCALAVLAANSIPIGFFSVAALVLVFGLSLDYIFFMIGKKNKEERKLTFSGVTLSFLTTILSFGALAFSSFMPVHLFGLTVCAGLGAAFISALIFQSKESTD
jgi:predicted exporter